MSFKRAFTMAEAIIVMTILGIIATIMITNLKPTEFRDKGLQVQAKKILQQLDTATQQIMINNTQNGKLTTIYAPGVTNATFSFSTTGNNAALNALYKKYLTTTRKTCTNAADCGGCSGGTFRFYLKDGTCVSILQDTTAQNTIYPGEASASMSVAGLGAIFFDVNGLDEPNVLGKDRYRIPINADGIFFD